MPDDILVIEVISPAIPQVAVKNPVTGVIEVTPPSGPAKVITTIGKPGTPGLTGWSPVLANVPDSQRSVLQVVDWVGGQGSKPATGLYIGPSGEVSSLAAGKDIRGPAGPAGPAGSIVISGSADVLNGNGAPSDGIGVDNQLYLDNITDDVYKKITGHWVLQTNIKGATGNAGATGSAGADGASILTGSGAPGSGLGSNRDYYIDTTNFNLYAKSAGAWANLGSLRGANGTDGTDGATIRRGTGAPSSGLGNDGDQYLDTTAFNLYAKASGSWTLEGSLIGPAGSTGPQGASGSQGPSGAFGGAISLEYLASTASSGNNADPSGTNLAFDTGGARYQASGILFSKVGVAGDLHTALNAAVALLAANSSSTIAKLRIVDKTNPLAFYIFDVTGVTDHTDWFKLAVANGQTTTNDFATSSAPIVALLDFVGEKGDTGPAGSAGSAGANGTSSRFGSGVPSNGFGNDGDEYLNTANFDFYTKASGTWTLIGNIKGDPGSAGSAGSAGSPGAAGAAGRPGVDGMDGLDGDPGPPGPSGQAGAQGIQGLTGPGGAPGVDGVDGADGAQGPPGNSGAQGPQGTQGNTGSTGPSGADGRPGLDGADGQDGDPGFPGPAGAQGIQGTAGSAGANGADGRPGMDGMDGADGDRGPPGPTGDQGIQGIQGIQGNAGSTGSAGAQGVPGPAGIDGQDGDQGIPGPSGAQGIQGTTGSTGSPGTNGINAGFTFAFNSATSGDPGSGKLLFNNATFASATAFNISETDGNANSLTAYLATIDDSTSTNKSVCTISKASGAFFSFFTTGTITDNGTYDTFTITPIASGGTIANNDVVQVSFTRVGDKGDTGTTGSPGAIGATGLMGMPGYDGEDGIDGMPIPGNIGPQGIQGIQGIQGNPGADGSGGGSTSYILVDSGGGGDDSGTTWPIPFAPLMPGMVPGVVSNLNPPAGVLGEYFSQSTTGVSLVTATAKDITTLTVGAGIWHVSGVVQFVLASATLTANSLMAAIGTALNTSAGLGFQSLPLHAALTTTTVTVEIPVPAAIFQTGASTTFRLVAKASFTAGTISGGCRLQIIRIG
jgi:collagen type VII alpha